MRWRGPGRVDGKGDNAHWVKVTKNRKMKCLPESPKPADVAMLFGGMGERWKEEQKLQSAALK